MASTESFGEILNGFLGAKQRAQSFLANSLGIGKTTVSDWISKGAKPKSPEIIVKIAEVLELTAEERQKLLAAAGYESYLSDNNSAKQQQSTSLKARVIVRRPSEKEIRIAAYDLYCDGLEVAHVQPGVSTEFYVEPGNHTLKVRFTHTHYNKGAPQYGGGFQYITGKSPEIVHVFKEGLTYEFECGFDKSKVGPLKGLWLFFTDSSERLYIRLVNAW